MLSKGKIEDFYEPNEKYLFLGNGINLLTKYLNWEALLRRISEIVEIEIDFKEKTYPLIFEEIAFKLRPQNDIEHNIKHLKAMIAGHSTLFRPNTFHKQITNLAYYSHYITTNYDYCIEKSINENSDIAESKKKITPKYSLHRFNEIGGKRIWHIHGEIDNGLRGKKKSRYESILIGNEHYGDYLKKIHELIKSGVGKGLYILIRDAEENWVHLFFTRDIDIIGFGMDFTETHLWWLLNFRARMIRKGASINNKISFYYPSFSKNKLKPKLDLLKVLYVNTISINAQEKKYESFYKKFIALKSK